MPNKKQIVLIINVNNCCDSYAITFPQKDAVGKEPLIFNILLTLTTVQGLFILFLLTGYEFLILGLLLIKSYHKFTLRWQHFECKDLPLEYRSAV